MMRRIRRMWINQPSTSQACHRWHGRHVLADLDAITWGNTAQVYFTEGPEESAILPLSALSAGWPQEVQPCSF